MEIESAFSLPQSLESVYGGIERYDVTQMYPNSGNITNSFVGQGSASGTATFLWDEANWWSPSSSYFYIKFKFGQHAAGAFSAIPCVSSNAKSIGSLNPVNLVAYADNFVSTLFTTIRVQINNEPLEVINQPWIADQVLTYTNSKKNFLETFSTTARVGESLNTRLYNTYSKNTGIVEVCYRPPSSLFGVNLLPPGAQIKIDFDWRNNAAYAFESLIGPIVIGTANTEYNLQVQSFSLYKATFKPSMYVPVPDKGVIDLCMCQVTQYPINNSQSFQQNVTLPSTCNRIYIVFQDTNGTAVVSNQTTTDSPYIDNKVKYQGVGNGWTPATSFAKSFSVANGQTQVELSQLYITLPDIQAQLPTPFYNFTAAGEADYLRAYMDFCSLTQGTKTGTEGSIPYGRAITGGTGASVTPLYSEDITLYLPTITVGGAAQTPPVVLKSGNPSSRTNFTLVTNAIVDYGAGTNLDTLYFQVSGNGWLERSPGPIFVFDTPRPEGKFMSIGNLKVDFTAAPASINATVLCSYNSAIAVEKNAFGKYNYTILQAS